MRLVNILATENIKNEYCPQPIEFYLAHKILQHPDIYRKIKKSHAYKIVDCSACELKTGVDMHFVVKAANVIGASEIVLPDVVRSDDSLQRSLEVLERLDNKTINKFKIAIVIQGSTVQKGIKAIEKLAVSSNVALISTIMIPKWFATDERIQLTLSAKKLFPNKEIHWLGLGDDIERCMRAANYCAVRSMDTGYFISIAQKGMGYLLSKNRHKKHKIDLEHNKLTQSQIRQIISLTNTYDFLNSVEADNLLCEITAQFAIKAVFVILFIFAILFIINIFNLKLI